MKLEARRLHLGSSAGIVCCVVFLLFSNAINTLAELKIHFNMGSTKLRAFDRHVFLPNSGVDVLPAEVLEIRAILYEHPEIAEFNLSKRLQNDPYLYQRTVEGVWPRVFVASSAFLFLIADELPEYAGKKLITRGEKTALVFID